MVCKYRMANQRIFNILLIFFPLIAFFLILLTTRYNNLGISADSISYIEVSRNIKNLEGVVDNQGKLVQHWPPLYPAVLALSSGMTGLDNVQAGKYLNATLMALFFLLFNLLLRRNSLGVFPVFLINLLILFSLPLKVFLMFWAEGLFIVLLLTLLIVFMKWHDSKRSYVLILSGMTAGLMILTKYAGIGFILGIIFYLLFLRKDKISDKLKNFLILSFSVVVTVVPWIIYTSVTGEDSEVRMFAVHPADIHHLKGMTQTFISWIISGSIFPVKYILLIMVALIALLILKRKSKNINLRGICSRIINTDNYILILLSLILSYATFLFLSISFFDAMIPMNNRILSPLFPLIILLAVPALKVLIDTPLLRLLGLVTISVLIINSSVSFYSTWHDHYINGSGFTSKTWQDSETVKRLADFNEYLAYSNGTGLFKIYSPKNQAIARSLPGKYNLLTIDENTSYYQELAELEVSVESGKAVVIYFNKLSSLKYFPDESELFELLKDCNIIQFEDGFAIMAYSIE